MCVKHREKKTDMREESLHVTSVTLAWRNSNNFQSHVWYIQMKCVKQCKIAFSVKFSLTEVSMQFASKQGHWKKGMELSQHYCLSLSHRKSIRFSSLVGRLQAQTIEVSSSLSLSAELLQASLFWILKWKTQFYWSQFTSVMAAANQENRASFVSPSFSPWFPLIPLSLNRTTGRRWYKALLRGGQKNCGSFKVTLSQNPRRLVNFCCKDGITAALLSLWGKKGQYRLFFLKG